MTQRITKSLAVLAAAGALAVQAQDKQLVLDGSTTVGPIAKAFAEYHMGLNKGVNITVSESGSGNGAKSLVNGACDIACLSRGMKDKEFAAAAAKGIQPCPHVVALDGLAVIVHPSNPVRAFSTEQVRDIYLGKYTNWKQLGGPDRAIVVVTRDTNSGTFETFEGLVMAKGKITQGAEVVGSNGAVRARVAGTPGAIGYVGLGFVDNQVKALDIDGVTPDTDTIITGKYPIARPLYLYTNGYPKLGSLAHAFCTLHLTKKGQEIIESIGFVPTTRY
ncbi:MAG: phosphate ABC transporter substrate-binding protein [Lentisphaeria bacterium]|nr:phosphate ABC transporter substrate-binding protein [Lentisphaeria bacterium]